MKEKTFFIIAISLLLFLFVLDYSIGHRVGFRKGFAQSQAAPKLIYINNTVEKIITPECPVCEKANCPVCSCGITPDNYTRFPAVIRLLSEIKYCNRKIELCRDKNLTEINENLDIDLRRCEGKLANITEIIG